MAQVRGVRKIETIRTDIVGRQAFPEPRASCGGPDVAKAEPGWWCISATAGPIVAHALSTGLTDIERASVHIQRASEDLEEGPA